MRRSFAIFAFVLLVAAFCVAQTVPPSCPKIRIIGPSGVSSPGDRITFVAEVSGNGSSIKYEWTVDWGTIVEGQGTPAILVVSKKGGTDVKATVRIAGIPIGCENSASDIAGIAPLPELGSPVDQWDSLTPNDERSRFDNFFVSLLDNPTSMGLIVLRLTNKEKPYVSNSRVRLFLKHAKFRKFDLRRMIFGFDRSNYFSTTLWRVPPGAELPCSNCVFVYGRDLK